MSSKSTVFDFIILVTYFKNFFLELSDSPLYQIRKQIAAIKEPSYRKTEGNLELGCEGLRGGGWGGGGMYSVYTGYFR